MDHRDRIKSLLWWNFDHFEDFEHEPIEALEQEPLDEFEDEPLEEFELELIDMLDDWMTDILRNPTLCICAVGVFIITDALMSKHLHDMLMEWIIVAMDDYTHGRRAFYYAEVHCMELTLRSLTVKYSLLAMLFLVRAFS